MIVAGRIASPETWGARGGAVRTIVGVRWAAKPGKMLLFVDISASVGVGRATRGSVAKRGSVAGRLTTGLGFASSLSAIEAGDPNAPAATWPSVSASFGGTTGGFKSWQGLGVGNSEPAPSSAGMSIKDAASLTSEALVTPGAPVGLLKGTALKSSICVVLAPGLTSVLGDIGKGGGMN